MPEANLAAKVFKAAKIVNSTEERVNSEKSGC